VTSSKDDIDLETLFALLEGSSVNPEARRRLASRPHLPRQPKRPFHRSPTDELFAHFWSQGPSCDDQLLRRGVPPSLWPWPVDRDNPMRRIRADQRWLKKRLRRRPLRNRHLRDFLGWSDFTVAKLPSEAAPADLTRLFGLSRKLQGDCCWLRSPDLDEARKRQVLRQAKVRP
jgi:hypothetical protein